MNKDNYILCQKCQTNPCECGLTFAEKKLKEFDEKFVISKNVSKKFPDDFIRQDVKPDEIKSFLSEALKEQKEEILKNLKEIEDLKI